QYRGVDAVGHRGHQHVGALYGVGELCGCHGLVIEVELSVEEFAHARLDAIRKLARDDDYRFFALRHDFRPSSLPPAGQEVRSVQVSLTAVLDTSLSWRRHLSLTDARVKTKARSDRRRLRAAIAIHLFPMA